MFTPLTGSEDGLLCYWRLTKSFLPVFPGGLFDLGTLRQHGGLHNKVQWVPLDENVIPWATNSGDPDLWTFGDCRVNPSEIILSSLRESNCVSSVWYRKCLPVSSGFTWEVTLEVDPSGVGSFVLVLQHQSILQDLLPKWTEDACIFEKNPWIQIFFVHEPHQMAVKLSMLKDSEYEICGDSVLEFSAAPSSLHLVLNLNHGSLTFSLDSHQVFSFAVNTLDCPEVAVAGLSVKFSSKLSLKKFQVLSNSDHSEEKIIEASRLTRMTSPSFMFDGCWDLWRIGLVKFALSRTVQSLVVRGNFNSFLGYVRGDIFGFLIHGANGSKEFYGRLRSGKNLNWKPFRLTFDHTSKKFTGIWFKGKVALNLEGEKSVNEAANALTSKGIFNAGNTCYMNSFLQALFATTDFRNAVLQSFVAEEKKQQEIEPSIALIKGLQRIFFSMLLSHNASLDLTNFRSNLPEMWRGPEQQDTAEFGSYLVDEAESALSKASFLCPHDDFSFKSLFGGMITNVIRCSACGYASAREEGFTSLQLGFPQKYAPITSILVVSSPEHDGVPEVPKGFERINVNLNANNVGLPAFICVSRQSNLSPVTHLRIVSLEDFDWSPEESEESLRKKAEDLLPAGFELIPEKINNYPPIFLSYSRRGGSPLTMLDVIAGKNKNIEPSSNSDLKKIPINVNPSIGTDPTPFVFLCYSRAGSPIIDLQFVSGKEENVPPPEGYEKMPINLLMTHLGYRVLSPEELINPGGKNSSSELSHCFLCFKQGFGVPITGIELITNDRVLEEQRQGVQCIPIPISRKESNSPVFWLAIQRGNGCPISKISVFRGVEEPPAFGDSYSMYPFKQQVKENDISGLWNVKSSTLKTTSINFRQGQVEYPARRITGRLSGETKLYALCQYSHGSWKAYGCCVVPPNKNFSYFCGTWNDACDLLEGYVVSNGVQLQFNSVKTAPPTPPTEMYQLMTSKRRHVWVKDNGELCAQEESHHEMMESFFIEGFQDNSYCLKSAATAKYVSVEENGYTSCSADVPSIQTSWFLEKHHSGSGYIFRSAFGMVLCHGEQDGVYAVVSEDDQWADFFFIQKIPSPQKEPHADGSDRMAGFFSLSFLPEHEQMEFIVDDTIYPCREIVSRFMGELGQKCVFRGWMFKQGDFSWAEGYWMNESDSELVLSGKDFSVQNLMRFRFSDQMHFTAWIWNNDNFAEMQGRMDTYLCLTTWKDYTEQWKNGVCVASGVAKTNSLESLLQQYFNIQVMDGKNKYRCGQCYSLQRVGISQAFDCQLIFHRLNNMCAVPLLLTIL
jgi:hypothetical protein